MSASAPPSGHGWTARTRTRTENEPAPDQPETTISRLTEEQIRAYAVEARARLTARGGDR